MSETALALWIVLGALGATALILGILMTLR